MSKLGDLFVLGQQLSISAKEEASRYDLPQIDVDHLLLALLVSGGPAGELLRDFGVTLTDARRATEQVRTEHIARLGILSPTVSPRPIRDPSLGDSDWSPRALKVMSGPAEGGELALLARLLDEPSSLAAAVLTEVGVDLSALRVGLIDRQAASPSEPNGATADPGWRSVRHASFAPAPVADVWALVADPLRRPEWDTTIGTVIPLGPDRWELQAASVRPDGRPVRLYRNYSRWHYRCTAYEREEWVEWEIDLPDRRRNQPVRHRFSIHLRPVSGGTALELTLRWPRRGGWSGLRQIALGPAHRAVGTVTLVQYAAGISRTLR